MGIRDLARKLFRGSKRVEGSEEFQKVAAMLANMTAEDAVKWMEETRSRMTQFDFLTASLCQMTFRDRGSSDQIIYVGMLAILQMAIEQTLKDDETAGTILESKADESPESKEFIEYCTDLGFEIGGEEIWSTIEENARANGVPRLVELTNLFVNMLEQKRPRPPVKNLRGHYAALADHIFAIGLGIVVYHPDIAQELAEEPCPYAL